MIKLIKAKFRKEQFKPSLLSLIINSNYFVRRGIYKGIKSNTQYMTGKMLDFGCGTKPYRDIFNVDEYIGIDIINKGHSNDTSLVDVFYDGSKIPFDDEFFDSVYSSEVLTHVFDTDSIVAEIQRVLKKDGYALITVPFVWHENEKPNDAVRFTSFGICNILERNGFKIIKCKKYGTYFTTTIQMWNSFLFHTIFPKPVLAKVILTIIFIFPVQLIAFLVSPIMPRNNDLFNNTVVVVQRIK